MQMKKISVAAVSYLNTKPFVYGLEHSQIIEKINLEQEIPSVIAEKLIAGKTDLGLVPVVAISDIPEAEIVGEYCIGAEGEVGSVCLYSEVPIQHISQIYLDYQSRTSADLCKVLLKEFWKINPELLPATFGYEKKISRHTAGLVIGDRALLLKKNFQYCYDLGEAWKNFTGLPFVFACWVSNKELDPVFINAFNKALKDGLDNIPSVAQQNEFFYPGIDTLDYLSKKIQYPYTNRMKEGMEAFLELVRIPERV